VKTIKERAGKNRNKPVFGTVTSRMRLKEKMWQTRTSIPKKWRTSGAGRQSNHPQHKQTRPRAGGVKNGYHRKEGGGEHSLQGPLEQEVPQKWKPKTGRLGSHRLNRPANEKLPITLRERRCCQSRRASSKIGREKKGKENTQAELSQPRRGTRRVEAFKEINAKVDRH